MGFFAFSRSQLSSKLCTLNVLVGISVSMRRFVVAKLRCDSGSAATASANAQVRSETASFVEQEFLPSSSHGSAHLDSNANPQFSSTSAATQAESFGVPKEVVAAAGRAGLHTTIAAC